MNDSIQNANTTEQGPLDILRENIEREYRFKTVPMGYDKGNVRDFIREQKQAEAELRKGLEKDNERLRNELDLQKTNYENEIQDLKTMHSAELQKLHTLLEETRSALKEKNKQFENLCNTICTNVADWMLEYKNTEAKLNEVLQKE